MRDAPTRILMTADTVGGVWTYAVELAGALEPHGIEITLATMGPAPTASQWDEIAALRNVTLVTSEYQLEWMNDPWTDVDRAGEWLLELADRNEVDVVHLNGYAHADLPWDRPVLVVAHSCVLSWWAAVKREPVPDRYDEYRDRVTRGLSAADAVVAPTAAMLRALRENYAASFSGSAIPNSRDSRLFAPADKQPTIFTCGRIWDEAKNIQMLDSVAERLPWPVEAAGDTTHPTGDGVKLRNVRCVGRIAADQLSLSMADAAIFALPARYEPFGLSPLEAGLSGCALVLGDIPTLREVWSDAAIFVDPEDGDELLHSLASLIRDERRRSELGHRARARALEFSPAKMASAYVAAYARCLANHETEVAA